MVSAFVRGDKASLQGLYRKLTYLERMGLPRKDEQWDTGNSSDCELAAKVGVTGTDLFQLQEQN